MSTVLRAKEEATKAHTMTVTLKSLFKFYKEFYAAEYMFFSYLPSSSELNSL
jgi:hypothetical protein